MTPDEARELHEYTRWANAAMFDAAASLPPGDITASAPSSFPTVVGTLAHIVSAEWIWLRRWRGDGPTERPSWVTSTSLPELRSLLTQVEDERAAFLSKLTEADFGRVISYRTLAGDPHADPLGILWRHVANHATYHRGQAATQLRQLGHAPPNTDLVAFAWSRQRA